MKQGSYEKFLEIGLVGEGNIAQFPRVCYVFEVEYPLIGWMMMETFLRTRKQQRQGWGNSHGFHVAACAYLWLPPESACVKIVPCFNKHAVSKCFKTEFRERHLTIYGLLIFPIDEPTVVTNEPIISSPNPRMELGLGTFYGRWSNYIPGNHHLGLPSGNLT